MIRFLEINGSSLLLLILFDKCLIIPLIYKIYYPTSIFKVLSFKILEKENNTFKIKKNNKYIDIKQTNPSFK